MPKKPPQLAKLSRPRLYKAVARERLFRLLDEKCEHPVIWIVGPPGAGKTTLAASYLEEAGRPTIWYQMDSGDSDPATFFYYLKQAIDALSPAHPEPLPLLTQEYLGDVPAFVRRFFRIAFAHLPDDVVFVFDNYHEIAEHSTLHASLATALREIPVGANILAVSRANPPHNFAELLVNQRLVQVSWQDLRLSLEEIEAMATNRGITDRAVPSALLDQSSGWMGGVALMLDRLRDGVKLDNLTRSEAWDSVFDYFAGMIFDGAEEEMRKALMKTAFLPWVDSSLAEVVTGLKHAIRFPEELHRRHLFTDRRIGEETTFQYHALFRAFLINRASELLPEHERLAIAIQGGRELRARGRAEEAFQLFVKAKDWTAIENLIIETAPGLVAQGRWQTLRHWVESLPAASVERNSWVGYWAGRSITFVDPGSARRALQSAYQRFVETADPVGQLLSATTILEGIYFEFINLRQLDPWIEVVVDLLQQGVRGTTKEDDLRANSVVMMGATFRTPVHSMLEECLNRVLDLLNESFEPNLKVAAASMLHAYANVAMDPHIERMASSIARPILSSTEISPQRAVFYWKAEGYSHYLRGRYAEAFACFDAADEIRRLQDDDGNSVVVDIRRGLCERRAGLLEKAEETVRRVERSSVPLRGQHHAIFTLLRAVVAFDRGNTQYGIETVLKAYQAYDDAGFFNGVVTTGTVAANMAIAGGRLDIAGQILQRLREENYGAAAQNYLAAIIFNQAWLAHRQGGKTERNLLLRDALQQAHNDSARIRFHWYRNAMQELLPVALSEKIEADLASSLAHEFAVTPEPLDIEVWPWPLKIYALGKFELLIRGQQPDYSRKAPKKVLALLQAIVAFGGKEIPEQRILDALWPDEDGDSASRALTATVHRLRKLLANGEAILQVGGKLTLNEKCCWVDAIAFERRLECRDGSELPHDPALSLYRGAFLAQEEAPWAVPLRERLRSKFIQAVGNQGARLEKAGGYEQAIELYMRGIEADGLVESFYQGLMRCYEKLDRRTEAASVYRRLRQILSVTLGVLPSSESQRLFATLRAE